MSQHKPDVRAVHENRVTKVDKRKHSLGGQEEGVSETRDKHKRANQSVSCRDVQPIAHHGYLDSSETTRKENHYCENGLRDNGSYFGEV
jgi:hypothetical protein